MKESYVLFSDCEEDPCDEPPDKPAEPCDDPPDDPRDALAIPLKRKQNS